MDALHVLLHEDMLRLVISFFQSTLGGEVRLTNEQSLFMQLRSSHLETVCCM